MLVGDMATTLCILHLLLVCFLQQCLSQHASTLPECHCTNGCDVDFRCTSGCLQGWSGSTCQIRNIALNKPTQQSSTLNDCMWAATDAARDVCGNKTSSLAVDGVASSSYWSGTCTHTALNRASAWWRVDLGETQLITNLRIFFPNRKNDPKLLERKRGFLVRVDDRHCYQSQTNNRLSSPMNISCDTPTRGQHVTVRLPTLAYSEYILSLCEVEIYECADGSFGSGCSSWCSCRNTSEVCDKTTGHCESGCADGRTGTDCQEQCADGSFGPGCSSWCYCRNTSEVCDKTTGHCESGCRDGYTGTGCQETCPQGRYGSGCMETCGHCAGEDQNCDDVDGNCTRGCQDNWSGSLCKECEDYWFGDQCDGECRCKDRYEVCDKRTGHCDSGCGAGWTGVDCNTPSTLPECHCTNGCDVDFRCTSGCLQGWSGSTCQIPSTLPECHCINGCDVDFRCTSGCLQGWSGSTCQIRNIALNKPTQQSGTYDDCTWEKIFGKRGVCGNKTSSLAVDGVANSSYWSGTCTHTALNRTSAWWTVDLEETHLITNLRIFFPNRKSYHYALERMRGFMVRVDDRHCYQSQTYNRLSSPINISCDTPTRGQHVTVRLPTLAYSDYILTLCEVEIYECADGSFGSGCSSWCSCRNTSEVCDKTTGHCESGCADGRTGTDCQEQCADGSFGPGCSSWCYCRNTSEVCDKTTGHCESGCADGYTGTGCQETCPQGRYGSGCMERCGHCAGGDQNCDDVDGNCTRGCQDNWSGSLCKECEDYWFGDQCDGECRCKDTYEVCDKRTGQCDSGCEDGWTGVDCNAPCPDGTYGLNCTGMCGRCQNGQPCDRIEGECQSCAPRFKPPFCHECEDYFYGEQCSSTCGQCRGNVSCNSTSGECPDGCEPGRQGMTCHQECDEGRYGDGCPQTCGQCSGKCSPVDGSCDQEGCRDGWAGQRCDEDKRPPRPTKGKAIDDGLCKQLLVQEIERAKAETERAKAEIERAKAETERAKAEIERAKAETEKARVEVERARVETIKIQLEIKLLKKQT